MQNNNDQQPKRIKIGLFGFGNTGRMVADEFYRDGLFDLEWVVRRTHKDNHKYATRLLGYEADDAPIFSVDEVSPEFFSQRPVDIIGGNGTYIIADGKVLQDEHLENHLAEELFDFVEKNFAIRAWMLQSRDKGLVLYVGDISFVKKKMYQIYYALQGVYKEPYSFGNPLFLEQLKSAQLYKLMMYFGFHKDAPENAKKTNAYIRAHYPSVESSWIRQFIEITPLGCNKGEGLKKYCQIKGFSPDEVHVVGDSGNDIAMFKSFKNSYCMSHASPAVKKYATHIISRFPDLERYLTQEKE